MDQLFELLVSKQKAKHLIGAMEDFRNHHLLDAVQPAVDNVLYFQATAKNLNILKNLKVLDVEWNNEQKLLISKLKSLTSIHCMPMASPRSDSKEFRIQQSGNSRRTKRRRTSKSKVDSSDEISESYEKSPRKPGNITREIIGARNQSLKDLMILSKTNSDDIKSLGLSPRSPQVRRTRSRSLKHAADR